LPHRALAAKQAKPGLEKFAAILRALPYALQKFPMPCHHTMPPLFCLLSPEAVLLTEEGKQTLPSSHCDPLISGSATSSLAY